MTDSQPLPWKRLFAEATAIVLSILLAFAIDAWWEDRADRRAEQLLLLRLKADFVDIRSALLPIEDEHRETSAACVALMSIPEGEAVPSTPEYDRMVALVFLTSRTFNPGAGAVAAFLNGEGARLVDNQQLADLLLAWPGIVEDLQEEDGFLQEGLADRWIPFLKSKVNIGPYLAVYPEINVGIPGHVGQPKNRAPLMVDAELVNNVLDRYKYQQIVLRDIGPIVDSIDKILTLLDNDIATGP
ncbi:hypothetical protein [Congregibacter sp.]|uniref:hypothetical protein n=1 Tax=Congregibacter sp. TaxID=2744308 RepID=UPI003F6CF54C